MADEKDKNAQLAPAVDNTSPEEKALADKLMAELMASGVDVNALAAKTPIAPSASSGPTAAPAPAPAPKPAPAPAAPAPAAAPPPPPPPKPAPVAPVPAPAPTPSTSSGPTAPPPPPVPTPTPTTAPPAPTPAAPVAPPANPAPSTSSGTQDVESFIQSLDSTLARLNDSQFFVIRISKPLFYVLTVLLSLLLIIVPRLPH